jgi:hypothetical protein
MLIMTENHPLKEAVELVGLGPLAKSLGLTYPAIRKWQRAGRMPRTEWTGETTYSVQIQALTGGKVTVARLMSKWPALEVLEEKQPLPSAARSFIATESVAVQGGANA